MNYKRSWAFLACTHFGSSFAPLLPHEIERTHGLISPNALQKNLNGFLYRFFEETKHCDQKWVVGDVREGRQHKDPRAFLSLSNLDDQDDAAFNILNQWKTGNDTINILDGTTYHESKECSMNKSLAERLRGRYCGLFADVTVSPFGHKLNISHGRGGGGKNKGTFLEGQIKDAIIAEYRQQITHVDMIVRAHFHSGRIFEGLGKQFVLIPSVKAFEVSEYYMGNPYSMQPDVGGVIIDFDKWGIYPRIIKHNIPLDLLMCKLEL